MVTHITMAAFVTKVSSVLWLPWYSSAYDY